jgi:mxaD protein
MRAPPSFANLFRRSAVALALAAFAPLHDAGAAAALLKVSRSATVHLPVQQAWARIGRFDGVAAWHPAVSGDAIVAGANDTAGAVRRLTLRDGGTLTEKLTEVDAKHHRYRYVIVAGTLPVSDYASTFGIKAAGRNRSKVTWSSTFRRRAPHASDAAALKAVDDFYRAGLAGLGRRLQPR